MPSPKTPVRLGGWGALTAVLCIAAFAPPTSAADLKRLPRTPRPPETTTPGEGGPAAPAATGPAAPAGPPGRALIAAPSALAPVGSGYDALPAPGIAQVKAGGEAAASPPVAVGTGTPTGSPSGRLLLAPGGASTAALPEAAAPPGVATPPPMRVATVRAVGGPTSLAAPPAAPAPSRAAGTVVVGTTPGGGETAPAAAPPAASPAALPPGVVTPPTPPPASPTVPTVEPAGAPAQSRRTVIAPAGTAAAPVTQPQVAGAGAPAAPSMMSPGSAPEAPSGETQVFTPQSAADLALKNSLDLQITAANVREAEAELRKALGLGDVTASASGTALLQGPVATVTLPGSGGGKPTSFPMTTGEMATAQLSLAKPIYTQGRIHREQDVALRGLENRQLSRDVVARALDLSARQAIFGVLRAEQLAEVAQQQAVSVAAHLDLTRKLQAGGVVAKFEVVQAETELASAQGAVIGARTAVDTAKAGLRRLLTLPQNASVEVAVGAEVEAPPGDLMTLIDEAQRGRPEVRVAESAVMLADAGVRLAHTENNLQVSLIGSVNASTAGSFGSLPWGWQVGIQAQKPILDAGAQKADVRAAQARLDEAKLNLQRTKEEVGLDVTQSYLALQDARERKRVAQQGVVGAQERLRIAQVRYQSSIALGIEVLDAQTSLTAARAELVNAEYNLQVAICQLRSSVGLWRGNEGGQPK